jgi:hypothetical protein
MPAAQNPNIKRTARSDDVYMRSAFVALASFGRWNEEWERVLLTTDPVGPAWANEFDRIGARVEVRPFEHAPPAGFAPTFAGSLYLLDAVANFRPDQYLLLIDPDVLTVSAIPPSLAMDGRVAALEIPHSPSDDINRLTLAEAADIHRALGRAVEAVTHYGGEFYGLPVATRNELRSLVHRAWTSALDRQRAGLPYFTTEEHVMSFALADQDVRESSDVVQRVWTAHGYRTVTGREAELALWHLPAEKERAFAVLYDLAVDPQSWFWRAGQREFLEKSARVAGLSNRSFLRLLKDAAGHVFDRSRKTARRLPAIARRR